MFQPLFDYFQGSPVALIGLLTLLILCGVGLPIPEDIILITTGAIAQETGRSWVLASVVMYFGVLAGDSLIFAFGRQVGFRLLSLRWTQRLISPARQERIERLFKRHGSTVYFLARFLPGLRAAIYCTAGALRVRYLQFVIFDGVAALISVPVFVWLGHLLWSRFAHDVGKLRHAIASTQTYSLGVAALLVIGVGAAAWLVSRRPARTA